MANSPASAFGTTRPITGPDIALEVLQCLGYRYALKEAFIITYTLHDYEFTGHGLLSVLLRHQVTLGANITLLTTPPPGKGTRAGFKRKLNLLTALERNGITVFVNDNLHAKAYVFLDERGIETTIIGSANLTSGGLGVPTSPAKSWLEIALVTSDVGVYGATVRIVTDSFLNDARTMDFASWSAINREKIIRAQEVSGHVN